MKKSNSEYIKISDKTIALLRPYLVKLASESFLSKRDIHFKDSGVVSNIDIEIERKLSNFINNNWPDEFDIVGEELKVNKSNKKYCFFIDPLDGTRNFLAGNPLYAVSLGLWDLEKSEPLMGIVYAPLSKELFSWSYGKKSTLNGKPIQPSKFKNLSEVIIGTSFTREKDEFKTNWDRMRYYYESLSSQVYGFRTLQSDSLSLCWVACGRLDAAMLISSRNFDFAGGLAILTGAKGKFMDIDTSIKFNLMQKKHYNILISNPKLLNGIKHYFGTNLQK